MGSEKFDAHLRVDRSLRKDFHLGVTLAMGNGPAGDQAGISRKIVCGTGSYPE